MSSVTRTVRLCVIVCADMVGTCIGTHYIMRSACTQAHHNLVCHARIRHHSLDHHPVRRTEYKTHRSRLDHKTHSWVCMYSLDPSRRT